MPALLVCKCTRSSLNWSNILLVVLFQLHGRLLASAYNVHSVLSYVCIQSDTISRGSSQNPCVLLSEIAVKSSEALEYLDSFAMSLSASDILCLITPSI